MQQKFPHITELKAIGSVCIVLATMVAPAPRKPILADLLAAVSKELGSQLANELLRTGK